MPCLTIRKIPEDLHAKLEADAVAHGRSRNKGSSSGSPSRSSW